MKMFHIWTTKPCYLASLRIYMLVLITRYSLRYLSVKKYIYFIYQIVVVLSVWDSLSLRNNLFVLTRRITAIVFWAKPFGSEKLNNRDLKL